MRDIWSKFMIVFDCIFLVIWDYVYCFVLVRFFIYFLEVLNYCRSIILLLDNIIVKCIFFVNLIVKRIGEKYDVDIF